ncbi:hypothetical protein J4558_19920 [Leptolyngbya sp. 15MV]|nr:hypothetical protein J4558_19920 [Leptolyngbya sp. 15MV]
MKEIDRREFLYGISAVGLGFVAAGRGYSAATMSPIDIEEKSIVELQSMMTSGEASAKGIVEAYLRRIESLDKQINSIIELNPDALSIAEQMDRERREGKVRGPLHGIPVVIKDNVDTADKMKTTAGSLALLNAPGRRCRGRWSP